MKKISLLFLGFFIASTAQATLIFSDVSYTENTVSFRTTGDLSGYTTPARPQYFSIGFEGDLFTSGISQNISWSNAIFEGTTISSHGYAGDFSTWNTPGAWLSFSNQANSSSVALGSITTLTLGANLLNESSLTGEIVFNWDVDGDFTTHTELGRVSVNQVPEPASLILLGFGLAGFGFTRKRKAL